MPLQNVLVRAGLIAGLIFASPLLAESLAADSLKALVEQAWQIIDTSYALPSFNEQDWQNARAEFVAGNYATAVQAHTAILRMLARLHNPSVRLLTGAQFAAFLQEVSGQPHVGVGLMELLSLDLDERTGQLTIVTPVPDTPAARAGLQPRDVVTQINTTPASGMDLAEAMAFFRRPSGTAVTLAVQRGALSKTMVLHCDSIPSPDSAVRPLLKKERGKNLGYIGLLQFTASAAEEFRTALQDLLRQNISGLILDLRNNPGGYMPACTEIAGMLVGAKPMAMILGRGNNFNIIAATGEKITDKPLAVLVNEGSASAAELLAAALQSHERATLAGSPTFGKGLVHGFQPLADGSMLVVTLGSLQTLEGRELLHNGVLPEVLLEVPESPVLAPAIGVATAKDAQYQKAVAILLP